MTDANPYEKKAFIGSRAFTLHKDNSGVKYMNWKKCLTE